MKTQIAFILDRSGSMASMHHAAITGFNEFLLGQQNTTDAHGTPLPALFSLILFDDRYDVLYDSLPIAQVPPLTPVTYQPCGSTALLDAIGITIDRLGARLAAMPEIDRPGHVLIAILTDGAENASTQFSWAEIQQRIRHQTDVYQWEFLFLGANQDAIATASRMGIHSQNAATFEANVQDLESAYTASSKKASAMRKSKANIELDQEEKSIFQESLGQALMKEKEAKK